MSDIVKELFLTVDVIIGVDPFCSSETVVLFVFSFVLVFAKVFKLFSSEVLFWGVVCAVLLKEEEFASKSSKKKSNILGGIATAYWVTITAVFLYLNIVLVLDKAWIIWPIAGLAFAGIMAILNAVLKEE